MNRSLNIKLHFICSICVILRRQILKFCIYLELEIFDLTFESEHEKYKESWEVVTIIFFHSKIS